MRLFLGKGLLKESLSIVALLGVSSLMLACSSLPPEKRSFQKEINKAVAGDEGAARTVSHVYCTGDWYKLFKTYKNPQKCIEWTRYVLSLIGASEASNYIGARPAERYSWALGDLVRGDSSSHYSQQKVQLIEQVEAIGTDDAKLGLWYFYSNYPRHDKDKSRRTELSGWLCKKGHIGSYKLRPAEYCSQHANFIYEAGEKVEALRLYEQHGTWGALSRYNLARLYWQPPKGEELKPEESLKLMKSAYETWLNECYEEDGKHAKRCTEMKGRRDSKVFKIQAEVAFKQDAGLNRTIRLDKYKVAVTNYLKSKKYTEALVYFDLLERLDYQLPVSMSFFKAEAYFHTDEADKAKSIYQQYLNSAGKKGAYYRTALERLNEISAL